MAQYNNKVVSRTGDAWIDISGDTVTAPDVRSGVTFHAADGSPQVGTNEGTDIAPLTVTENGTYSAPQGTAYSPVTVDVPGTELLELEALANGVYTAPSGKAYNEVTVDVDDPDALEVEALTAEHNGLYVPESGHAYSSARVHVTTRLTGTGDLMIFVTAPTGCTVTAEKLDGDDEGALYTGVESQQTAGQYTIKVIGYGEYKVVVQNRTQRDGFTYITYGETTAVVVKPAYEITTEEYIKIDVPGYTSLAYLESSGTQWISTGIVAPDGFRVVGNIRFPTGGTSGNPTIIGSHGGAGVYNFIGYYGGIEVCNPNVYLGPAFDENRTYSVDVSNHSSGICKIDGEEKQLSYFLSAATRCQYPLGLFANVTSSDGSTAAYNGILRVYGDFRIYTSIDNSSLVSCFFPMKRSSDGVIGLYDTVRQQFFTNAGTGTFIAGPELA